MELNVKYLIKTWWKECILRKICHGNPEPLQSGSRVYFLKLLTKLIFEVKYPTVLR